MKYPHYPIDWILLAKAHEHYSSHEFKYKETPYAIPLDYHSGTKPHDNQSFVLDKGIFEIEKHELVGSAEQGFIYQLINNEIKVNDKLFSISPCFRYDNYDLLHQPWFMKLELFHFSNNFEELLNMIMLAKKFLKNNTKEEVSIVKISENMYDLEVNKIEVGSFGCGTVVEKSIHVY